MRPNLHPRLVNGRFGDPALFVETLHRREALLFDAGDLSALSARDLLRVTHLFISHMHMDHFIGFDALLRVNVGREKAVRVLGPPRMIDRLGHKLQGYEWDLAERYATDLHFQAVEIGGTGPETAARFSFTRRFECEAAGVPADWEEAAGLTVETALLEHHGPCLSFAGSESAHVNVWKSRLDERGLATGQWLQRLKSAVIAGKDDDEPIELPDGLARPLGELRDLVTVTRGQKIAYVTDVATRRRTARRSSSSPGARTCFSLRAALPPPTPKPRATARISRPPPPEGWRALRAFAGSSPSTSRPGTRAKSRACGEDR